MGKVEGGTRTKMVGGQHLAFKTKRSRKKGGVEKRGGGGKWVGEEGASPHQGNLSQRREEKASTISRTRSTFLMWDNKE